MAINDWVARKREVWHKRFFPSVLAGVAVAFLTLIFKATTANILMFASLGASAAILTERGLHRLTILRTILLAYFFALIVGLLVLIPVHQFALPFGVSAFLSVALTILLMYLFNAFHPPAAAASLAFVTLDGGVFETTAIFFSVIVLLAITKILTFVFYYERQETKHFLHELRKYF